MLLCCLFCGSLVWYCDIASVWYWRIYKYILQVCGIGKYIHMYINIASVWYWSSLVAAEWPPCGILCLETTNITAFPVHFLFNNSNLQFAICNLQFTIYNLQFTIWNLQFTIYNPSTHISRHTCMDLSRDATLIKRGRRIVFHSIALHIPGALYCASSYAGCSL